MLTEHELERVYQVAVEQQRADPLWSPFPPAPCEHCGRFTHGRGRRCPVLDRLEFKRAESLAILIAVMGGLPVGRAMELMARNDA